MLDIYSMISALICAFLICLLTGGKIIAFLRKEKAGQVISDNGPERHHKKQGTPTMGGLIILLALTVSSLIFGGRQTLPALIVTLAFGGIGFLDDFLITSRGRALGLRARSKFGLQVLVGVVTAFWLLWIGHSTVIVIPRLFSASIAVDLGYFYYLLVVILLVGFSNAVNLTDGLDGLAAGSMAISMVPIAIMTLGFGLFKVNIFAAAVAGACLGFLWFNSYPAKIFMGDTGSLALGGALAMTAILTKTEILLLFFAFIFIVEVLSVMIQVVYFKLTHGRRVFKMAPLHHHFELSGWQETQVVTRFWLIQLIFCVLGFVAASLLLGQGIWKF